VSVRVFVVRPWHLPALLSAFLLVNPRRRDIVAFRGRLMPAILAAGCGLPGLLPGHRAYMVGADGRFTGLGVTRPRHERRQASIISLVLQGAPPLALAVDEAPGASELHLCADLLGGICADHAAQGFVSVFARLPDPSAFEPAFAEAGFATAVREHTYVRPPASAPEPPDIPGLRVQDAADAWEVFQLYRQTTPAPVQQAEALTSRRWESPSLGRSVFRGGGRPSEIYVVDGPHGLDAWLEVRLDAGDGHRLELMVHPRSDHLVTALLAHALWRAGQGTVRPVGATVRDHQASIAAGLRAAGFDPSATHRLLVKHMAIRVSGKMLRGALDRATN